MDDPPTLTNASVHPSSPTGGNKVYFNVTYRDLDNDAPTHIHLDIENREHNMSKSINMTTIQSYSYDIGLVYSANLILHNGTYHYSYHAKNTNASVSLPSSGSYTLTVGSSSDLPMLHYPIVGPSSPHHNQTVNFTIRYRDPSGGRQPHHVRLHIKPTDIPNPTVSIYDMATSGTDFKTGVIYYKTLRLASGNYMYMYHLIVGNFSARYPDGYNLTLYVKPLSTVNHSPVLLNGGHSPNSPTPGSNVTFSVTYKDLDGDPPTYIRIGIANWSSTAPSFSYYNLTWTKTSYSKGVAANLVLNLGKGNFRYFFTSFSKGSDRNMSVRYPSSSYLYVNVSSSSGPKDIAPVLFSPGFSPARPTGGQSINFTIYYKDADGDAPSYVKLFIKGAKGTLPPYSLLTSGTDYRSGISCYKVLILSSGNYTYYYQTSSGNSTVVYPPSGALSIYVVPSGTGGGDPGRNHSNSAKLSLEEDGDIDLDLVEIEDGLTMEITDYKDEILSLRISSDTAVNRILSLEMDPSLFGELTEIGLVIELDGKKMALVTLEELLSADGDLPLYHLEFVDGHYVLHVYIPNATNHELRASMGKDKEDGGGVPTTLIALIGAGVIISAILVIGISLLTSAQTRKKQEAFYRDFDLDLDEGEEAVTGGRLNKDTDWDEILE